MVNCKFFTLSAKNTLKKTCRNIKLPLRNICNKYNVHTAYRWYIENSDGQFHFILHVVLCIYDHVVKPKRKMTPIHEKQDIIIRVNRSVICKDLHDVYLISGEVIVSKSQWTLLVSIWNALGLLSGVLQFWRASTPLPRPLLACIYNVTIENYL